MLLLPLHRSFRKDIRSSTELSALWSRGVVLFAKFLAALECSVIIKHRKRHKRKLSYAYARMHAWASLFAPSQLQTCCHGRRPFRRVPPIGGRRRNFQIVNAIPGTGQGKGLTKTGFPSAHT